MSLFKKVGYNTLFQLLGKLVSALATFLVLALVARKFGEAGTGEFTLVLSYVALFYLLADFGFNAVVVKKMVGEKKRAARLFSNLLGLRTIWAGGLIVFAFLLSRFLPYSVFFRLGVPLVLITVLTQAVFVTSNAFFQSRLRYDLSVIASSLGSLTTLFFAYLFILKDFSLAKTLTAYSWGGLIMAAAALFIIYRLGFNVFPRFEKKIWQSLLVTTLPLALTLIVDLLHFKVDTFFLAYFRPMTEVGVYNLAYKVFENILVLPVFFVNSFYPLLVEKQSQGIKNLRLLVKKVAPLLVSGGGLIFLGLFLFAPLVVRILAGGGFEGSVLALRILAFSLPAFFTTALLMWVLITLGKNWLLFRIYFLAMVLDLILNLVFIPKFGYLAAAATTGVTEVLVLGLESFFVWKLLFNSNRLN